MVHVINFQEENLIAGCLKQDRQAQEQLYRMYADEMYIVCLAYEKDRDVVKDILQDSFIKVFNSIGNYDRKGALKAWIRRIVVNTAIDHYRKKRNDNLFIDVETIEDKVAGEIDGHNNFGVKDILKQIKRLPDGARVIFNLFALEGYSHKEIAQKLSITVGTSKSQYSRARQLLQHWIES